MGKPGEARSPIFNTSCDMCINHKKLQQPETVSVQPAESEWELCEEYDWTKPTFENYWGGKGMCGPYAAIRSRMDDYHGCYLSERQGLQDRFIGDMIGHGSRVVSPWVVFSAGPFFSGKSFVLSWLIEQNHLPLQELVVTDPDRLRSRLPEWPGYLQHQAATAAEMTQREAGTCALVAQWEAFRLGRHVWIDGSLQNATRQAAFFAEIRAAYPQYKIAIVDVQAEWETILERSANCPAREGGRVTPLEQLQFSFGIVSKSVAQLAPLADAIVHVANDQSGQPRISDTKTEGANEVRSWEDLHACFSGESNHL